MGEKESATKRARHLGSYGDGGESGEQLHGEALDLPLGERLFHVLNQQAQIEVYQVHHL